MYQNIANDIAVNIKDQLRTFRYTLRRTRHNQADDIINNPFASKAKIFPKVALNQAASVAATVMDKAFSTAEAISIALVSDNPAIHDHAPVVQSLDYYFSDQQEAQRAFHRDMYYLTKAVLRSHHAENMLIHEAIFISIYNSMMQKYGADIARLYHPQTDIIQQSARLCTALFQEMVYHKPAQPSETVTNEKLISSYAAVSLACGLATAKAADMENTDNLKSATLTVEARFDRILTAINNKDETALQKLFAMLIFHLP